MRLTIITINLNNAEGLLKTIESVFSQSMSDFEMIVVDGASTDGSVELAKSFEDKRDDITYKWISEPDSGVYQAMNKGIRIAKGEYLLFLNSGDFLVDDKVLDKLFKEPYSEDILCGKCNVSDNGKVVWTSNPPEFITFGTLYNVGLAHQSTFIKRALFINLGLYREDFRYNSDIDFWYRSIILNGATTKKIDLIVSDYNLDGISSQENMTEQFQKEIKEILSQANFNKFVPDYKGWKEEKESMQLYYWVKRKNILNSILKVIYTIAVKINKIK